MSNPMHISKAIATPAPSQQGKPAVTTAWENRALPDWHFETFGEPQLERALAEAQRFCREFTEYFHSSRLLEQSAWPGSDTDPDEARERFENAPRPRWLSLVGDVGTGKTMLARCVYDYARSIDYAIGGGGARFANWPKTEDAFLSRRWKPFEKARAARFLALDDIGAGQSGKDMAVAKLMVLLEERMRRWTMITSNLEMSAIERMDARIASRMIRDGSRVVKVNAEDYGLRDKVGRNADNDEIR